MITAQNIDEVLRQLNVNACIYESEVIRVLSENPDGVPISVLSSRMLNEEPRLGSSVVFVSLLQYIYGTVWAFSQTGTEDGDLIILRDEYVQRGYEMVNANRALFGSYIFPLFLYGSEYIMQMRTLLKEEDIDASTFDLNYEYDYARFTQGLVGIAIQTRFCHIRDCLNHKDLGDDEFSKTDFSHVRVTTHNILDLEKTQL